MENQAVRCPVPSNESHFPYPQETSWAIYDELNNELIETGELSPQDSAYAQEVCVDYTSCLSLTILPLDNPSV